MQKRWLFEELDTLRKTIIARAGRLTRPQGKLTLTLNANRILKVLCNRHATSLLVRDADDDFALSVTLFEIGQRFANLGKRENAVDYDFELTGIDETSKLGEVGATRVHDHTTIVDTVAERLQTYGQTRQPEEHG